MSSKAATGRPSRTLDQVSRPQTRGFGGTAGDDGADARRDDCLPGEIGDGGKEEDRSDDIRGGARGDDRGARPERLRGEARRALQRFGALRLVSPAVPSEAHIAADGRRREPPTRAETVDEAKKLRAESDGKNLGLHPEPSGDEKMPAFVHQGHEADDERERRDVRDCRQERHSGRDGG